MSTLNIRVTRPRISNYTPADLIAQWARENGRPYANTRYGKPFLSIGGLPFAYDHWNIEPINSTADRITITLTQISAWDI